MTTSGRTAAMVESTALWFVMSSSRDVRGTGSTSSGAWESTSCASIPSAPTTRTRYTGRPSGVQVQRIRGPIRFTLDAFPPRAIAQVPLHGFREPRLEIALRSPAQLRFDFRDVDGVAPVMSETVCDVLDQRIGFSQLLQDFADDRDVRGLRLTADVVDLADLPLRENHPDGVGVVQHVDPVAD